MGLKIRFLYISLIACSLLSAQEFMDSDSLIQLNEVVVRAYHTNSSAQKIPGSISVITNKETEAADGNSFTSALHSVPGIYMHSGTYGTSRIVIRGVGSRTPYNTNRIKSYLNDIPITSSDGISTPEDIDLLSINRMEIIKGPASMLYGSGLGGNINLYTHSGNNITDASALVQYGSYNTLKTSLTGNLKQGNFNLFGNISHTQSDGYRENNHFKRTSLLTSGKWRQPSYSIEYTLLVMNMSAGIPSSIGRTLYETNPQAAAANWNAIQGYKKYSKGIGGITLNNKLSSNWNNRLTVFGSMVNSYEKRPFNNLDDGTWSFGIRDKLSFHLEKWDVVSGFEFANDTYSWQMDKDDALINKNSENRNQLNLFGLAYFRPTAKWNLSIGGALNKVNYKLTDKFSANGDQSGSRDFPFIFSPRFGVNFSPNEKIAVFSSIGHGFSMPSPEETLLPEGDINKDIQPEQGVQVELGVRLYLFDNKTRFDAAIYQINLNNLLVTKRLAEDIFTGINAGKTRHRGIELLWKQELFASNRFPGNLDMHANYTLSDNVFIDFAEDGNSYNGNQLPGIPSHLAQAGFNWEPIDALLLQTQFQFVGMQYMNDANTEKANNYHTLQVKATYNIEIKNTGRLGFYLGINNLTNAHYASMISVNALSIGRNEPRYYYPGMPRHFYSGIRLMF